MQLCKFEYIELSSYLYSKLTVKYERSVDEMTGARNSAKRGFENLEEDNEDTRLCTWHYRHIMMYMSISVICAENLRQLWCANVVIALLLLSTWIIPNILPKSRHLRAFFNAPFVLISLQIARVKFTPTWSMAVVKSKKPPNALAKLIKRRCHIKSVYRLDSRERFT